MAYNAPFYVSHSWNPPSNVCNFLGLIASRDDVEHIIKCCQHHLENFDEAKIRETNSAEQERRESKNRAEEIEKMGARGTRPLFIYLMKNERNGFIKIGQAAYPKYREKTLQGEDPQNVILCYFKGVDRDERELHRRFHSKRVRGEWFKLSQRDIETITGGKRLFYPEEHSCEA